MAKNSKRAGTSAGRVGRPIGSRSTKQDGIALARRASSKQVRRVDWTGVDRAQRVIEFIEKLTIPSGIGQGRPFILREFQRKFIRDVYGRTDAKNRRLVRKAILSIARKNGKTALIAALVLVHLIGPESVINGEIYSAANDRDQAAQVFKVAAQMVRADPELSLMLRVIDSTKNISCYSNGSFYRAISAEAGTKHGLNPTFIIYDELAQSKSRALYDVLDTSQGAREEPLFAVISTQSNDPHHIMSQLVDDGLNSGDPSIVCHLYEVDIDCKDIFDPSVWIDANPALGDFRSLEDFKALADRAQRMPSEEAKFRNLYLNQRVSSSSPLITRKEWLACAGEAPFTPGEAVYLALDMSAIVDLTSLAMISQDDPTRVASFNWKPKKLLLEHSARDFGSGSTQYVQWEKEGYILTSPGRSIDAQVVALKIAELYREFKVIGLAYDRWRINDLFKELDKIGLAYYEYKEEDKKDNRPGLRVVPWGQGYKDMAPAIDAFEKLVVDRKLIHPSNKVLTWAMGNAMADMDPSGNRKLDKELSKFRIDPAVSLAMAIGYKSRDITKPKPKYQMMVI